MATMTKYPKTVSQMTGGKYVSWSNLNNIKNSVAGSWAVSNVLIKSKSSSPNRPSTITCTNFGFNLPQGAEPTKVIITYRHEKVAGSDYTSNHPNRICNIPSPTISLVGVSGFSSKGVAPTTSMQNNTKTFKANLKDNKNLDHKVTTNVTLSRSIINSSSFGVKINYPTNSNSYNGYMRISYVRIQVEYKTSSYGVTVRKVSGGYNKEDYTVQLSISNKHLTSYTPSLTLTSPIGFSYAGSKGTGKITRVNTRTFTWDPKLTSKKGSSSINLTFSVDVTYPSGTSSYSGLFTLSESLNGATSNHTAVITEKPVISQESITEEFDDEVFDEDDSVVTYTVPVRYPYDPSVEVFEDPSSFNISNLTDLGTGRVGDKRRVTISTSRTIQYNGGVAYPYGWTDIDPANPLVYEATTAAGALGINWHFWLSSDAPKDATVTITVESYTSEDEMWETVSETSMNFIFKITREIVNTFALPNLTILSLTQEELDRLGTGYTYILQSDMKHSTSETYNMDFYKNNRVGVFNNPITSNITVTESEDPITGEIIETIVDTTDYDNLTFEEIFNNADYWSDSMAGVNEYGSVECEFSYNEDYPLYIIYTGDYPAAATFNDYDVGSIYFTAPCITEKTYYTDRTAMGNFPSPISSLLTDDGVSECIVASLNQSDSIILYDFPLDDNYGNDGTVSIRGIELVGNIEQSDMLILDALLISDQGSIGERSVVLDDQDSLIDGTDVFNLGGLGDFWGFDTQDLINLEDWEILFTINNLLLDDVGSINFGDLQLILYVETLKQQDINVKVNGEDLSYYGCFIDEVIIPEGLKTDTSLITIDGTDTNDAYRQNIKEKSIEISFNIGECDITTSTDMLRQVTKLLVNEKDNINRPIPNTIEFSHCSDVVYEYIMTDPLDITPKESYYDVKAKLTIPAGTAYSKQPTTTNVTGNVQGLAAVNPKITFKAQSSTIEIKEVNSGQIFSMGYAGDWQSKIVELDCANRIASLKTNEEDSESIDISGYVDFNSDWFSLYGEYNFTGTNCVIRTVEYKERW